jgi:hypothetical protein
MQSACRITGSTTGAGGGFIQMIPTQAPQPQPAGNSPLATQTPATPPPPSTPSSTPPALPPTVCPPTQHYDTSQQKCVDG